MDGRVRSSAYEFGAPTIEMRIHVSVLGLISDDDEDGITIIHANIGNEDNDYPAPADAVDNSPATWARMTYGEYSMPVVTISGHVYDTDTANPVANYTVELGSGNGGALFYTRTTDANGAYFHLTECLCRPGEPIWVRRRRRHASNVSLSHRLSAVDRHTACFSDAANS